VSKQLAGGGDEMQQVKWTSR